ncbi:hypothetical protein [Methylosinus sp. LW4]|uniref:hypothetical protein n=1 Tax=Methylosinus sp. LW4 TaxID=136993 RepID=UPI0012FBCF36
MAFLARELGLEKVAVQRGWEALKACGMAIQAPRPKNPKSASPEEAAAFKKPRRRRRGGSREASRAIGRGLRQRRAQARPETGHAARLGRPSASGRSRMAIIASTGST